MALFVVGEESRLRSRRLNAAGDDGGEIGNRSHGIPPVVGIPQQRHALGSHLGMWSPGLRQVSIKPDMKESFSRTEAGSQVHQAQWISSSFADSYGGHHTPHSKHVEQKSLNQCTNESFLDESNLEKLALRKSLNLTSPYMNWLM